MENWQIHKLSCEAQGVELCPTAQAWVSGLQVASCVTLDTFLNLSEPQVPHLEMKMLLFTLQSCWENSVIILG